MSLLRMFVLKSDGSFANLYVDDDWGKTIFSSMNNDEKIIFLKRVVSCLKDNKLFDQDDCYDYYIPAIVSTDQDSFQLRLYRADHDEPSISVEVKEDKDSTSISYNSKIDPKFRMVNCKSGLLNVGVSDILSLHSVNLSDVPTYGKIYDCRAHAETWINEAGKMISTSSVTTRELKYSGSTNNSSLSTSMSRSQSQLGSRSQNLMSLLTKSELDEDVMLSMFGDSEQFDDDNVREGNEIKKLNDEFLELHKIRQNELEEKSKVVSQICDKQKAVLPLLDEIKLYISPVVSNYFARFVKGGVSENPSLKELTFILNELGSIELSIKNAINLTRNHIEGGIQKWRKITRTNEDVLTLVRTIIIDNLDAWSKQVTTGGLGSVTNPRIKIPSAIADMEFCVGGLTDASIDYRLNMIKEIASRAYSSSYDLILGAPSEEKLDSEMNKFYIRLNQLDSESACYWVRSHKGDKISGTIEKQEFKSEKQADIFFKALKNNDVQSANALLESVLTITSQKGHTLSMGSKPKWRSDMTHEFYNIIRQIKTDNSGESYSAIWNFKRNHADLFLMISQSRQGFFQQTQSQSQSQSQSQLQSQSNSVEIKIWKAVNHILTHKDCLASWGDRVTHDAGGREVESKSGRTEVVPNGIRDLIWKLREGRIKKQEPKQILLKLADVVSERLKKKGNTEKDDSRFEATKAFYTILSEMIGPALSGGVPSLESAYDALLQFMRIYPSFYPQNQNKSRNHNPKSTHSSTQKIKR